MKSLEIFAAASGVSCLAAAAQAGQAPFATSAPTLPVSHADRVYAAKQFSNTVSVIDSAANELLGVIRPSHRQASMSELLLSQEAVDSFYHAAIAAGGREKISTAPQPQYGADCYATWVLDPDGHDIEVVNKTGRIR